jgi:hypothetical protein
VTSVGEESAQPGPEQDLVFGDHDAHGSSAVRVVPVPGRLSMRRAPPRAATRSDRPLSPEPGTGSRAADPVVETVTTSRPSSRRALSEMLVACACLTALVSPSHPMK